MNKSLCYRTLLLKRQFCEGFSLSELLIGALLMSVVISGVGFGLINVIAADTKVRTDSDRNVSLNRALDYLSNDIRESKKVAATTADITEFSGWTSPTGYAPVLFLLKSDNTKVAYYVADASGTYWQAAKVIYRATASGVAGSAFVDAISATSPSSSQCSGSGTASESGGFKTFIQSNSSVAVCLLGQDGSKGQTYFVKSLSSTKSKYP
jgi:type II secretory pathway component PulJ